MDEELKISTSSAMKVSQGVAFGLEGNLFIILLAGVLGTMFLLILLIGFIKLPLINAITVSIMPLLLVMVYLKIFRIGKPPAYQKDLIDLLMRGDTINPHPKQQKRNPYISTRSN
ncbi:MAG TPA: hypothetical protein DD381_13240 [Lentisphaeria bacterium]|nr:MAG: hypothetical protein A2X47_11715 [Lentisphaerae bacterium GWF2_38_69]HBM17286.1 hypothetical protein [Lentisphaeria bacterium]